jgi:PAS domain S-box-containing protein
MNPLSLILLIATMIYLYLGVYPVRREPSSPLNRIFLLTCLCFAVWAFSFSFMHAAETMDEIMFWYNMSSPGWCLFSGAAIHFLLMLSKKEGFLRRWWVYLVLYGPGLVLVYKQVADSFAVTGFVRVGWGLAEIAPVLSGWYLLFMVYQAGYIVLGLISVSIWGVKTGIRRERKQALMMFVTTSITLILAFTNDILLPALKVYLFPSISPLIILIWAFGMWYSITRYRLMSVNIESAAGEIITRMKDMVILLDTGDRIVKINPRVTELLGYDEWLLLQKPFGSMVREREYVESGLSSIKNGSASDSEMITGFLDLAGRELPVKMTATMLRDRYGDPIGTVVVGTDIRETIQLRNEIRERMKTEAELHRRNEMIEADLQNAHLIQKALLPTRAPEHARLLVDFRNRSVSSVGGDYFSFAPVENDGLGVFIGDVSGHGVSAALFLSLLKSASERSLRGYGMKPMYFIRDLNDQLLAGMLHYFVTAIYGYFGFSGDRTEFTFSKGGHPNPVIYRADTGETEFLECEGTLLGKFENIRLNERSVRLSRGDRVFLYTDGLPETRNGEGAIYGYASLVPLIGSTGGEGLSDALDGILREIDLHRGDAAVEDDVVIIGVEVL